MSKAENSALEGKWNVIVKAPTGKRPSVLDLAYTGDVITGTQSSPDGITPVSDVQVDGTKISWVNQVTKPIKLTVTFTGEIDGNSISGKAKIGFMGSYPFTAVKE